MNGSLERLMLYVEEPAEEAIQLALRLAKALDARLFAVYIIDTSLLPTGARRHQKLSELEDRAWQMLYEIENDASEQDVRISLLLDQGPPKEVLFQLVLSYEVDLLVVSASTRLNVMELVHQCPAPVAFAGERRGSNKEDMGLQGYEEKPRRKKRERGKDDKD